MKRNLENLTKDPFEILIVGGGILGSAILHEATERGFHAALIEKGDFGQATSANSLKTIHGGLRYFQQADLTRIRQSIRARRKFMVFASHLVHPQPFIIPIYGHGNKGKEVMTVGLMMNDLMSWDRNRDLPEKSHLPRGKVLSAEDCLKIIPGIEKQGLTGGALWYDGQAQHTERLTLEFILDATEKGAVAANYIQAEDLIMEQGAIAGVKVKEVFSKTEFSIRTDMVINASGPWFGKVLRPAIHFAKPSLSWVKGINLIVRKPFFGEFGVGLQDNKKIPSGQKSRFYYFVPWKGLMLIGTAYNRYDGDPDAVRLERKEITNFLEEINSIYPQGRLTEDDVIFAHFGLQPVSEGQEKHEAHPEPDRHSEIFDHESQNGVKGLISVKSTKYTTAVVVAEKVLDLIKAKKHKPDRVLRNLTRLAHYNKTLLEKDLDKIPFKEQANSNRMLVEHFWQNYGPRSQKLLEFLYLDPGSTQYICRNPLLTKAEVIYGIREEAALKLADIVCRRTNLAQIGCPSLEGLQEVSEIMSRELDWDPVRQKQELESVLELFQNFRKGS